MMTKCPSKRQNLLNRIGCDGSNDDQMSLKETKFMKQKCSRRMKWMGKCPVSLVVRGQNGGGAVQCLVSI